MRKENRFVLITTCLFLIFFMLIIVLATFVLPEKPDIVKINMDDFGRILDNSIKIEQINEQIEMIRLTFGLNNKTKNGKLIREGEK